MSDKLITLMKYVGFMNNDNLPREIEILTHYNDWHGEGSWETIAFNCSIPTKIPITRLSSPNGRKEQHETFVDYYIGKGYDIIEQIDSALEEKVRASWDKKLEGIPGLDDL